MLSVTKNTFSKRQLCINAPDKNKTDQTSKLKFLNHFRVEAGDSTGDRKVALITGITGGLLHCVF